MALSSSPQSSPQLSFSSEGERSMYNLFSVSGRRINEALSCLQLVSLPCHAGERVGNSGGVRLTHSLTHSLGPNVRIRLWQPAGFLLLALLSWKAEPVVGSVRGNRGSRCFQAGAIWSSLPLLHCSTYRTVYSSPAVTAALPPPIRERIAPGSRSL